MQLLYKQMDAGTSASLAAETVIYVHVTWHALQAHDISLGPLMLPVCEAGEFVGSVLL